MKNKTLAILLCAAMVVSLGACGKTNKDSTSNNLSGNTSTELATEFSTEQLKEIKYDASDYVTLGDYKKIKVTVDKDYKVTDQEINDYIDKYIITNYPYYVASPKTTVEEGDVANIDYEGMLDGKDFDGGTDKNFDLQIGSNTFIEGFEKGLIGATVGKETDLNLTFPADYNQKDLAGKAVVFKVTVNAIKQKQDMTAAGLTDDYVKYLSDTVGESYTTVADLKQDITKYLTQQNDSSKAQAVQTQVLDKLAEVCKVKSLPDGLLEQQIDSYIERVESNVPKGTSIKDYLSTNYNMTEEQFQEQISSEIEKSLNQQMILEAIAKKEKIKADGEDFNTYVKNMMSSYGYTKESQLYKAYAKTQKAGKDYLQRIYVCNKALSKVIDSADVVTKIPDSTEQSSAQPQAATTESSSSN